MGSQAGQPGVYSSPADALLQLLNILTTKGDILTRDDSGNLVRVPVGLDGQQLTANSGVPEGIDWQAGTVAPVDTVFGRIGNVIAAAGDYDASQVDNDSDVGGATVKDALNTLLSSIFKPAFGEIYISSAAQTIVTQTPIYTPIAGTTSLGEAYQFDMPTDGCLRYIGTETKKFKVTAAISSENSTNVNTYLYRLEKNTTPLSKSEIARYLSGVNDTGALALSAIVELAQNDYVCAAVSKVNAPGNMTVRNMNLIATALN